MKKFYLKISVIFIILFSVFVNCSYAESGLDVLQEQQQISNFSSVYLSREFNGASIKKVDSNIQSIDEVIAGANNFISSANTTDTISQDATQETIDLIYNVLLAVGLVIAVVCGVILGIQFMTSSADGQAQVKEKLVPYVVGCVIIFGAFGIWKLVMVLLKGF